MFATLTKEVCYQNNQRIWINGELREEARFAQVFPVGSTAIIPVNWKECKRDNAPMDVQLANGPSQARISMSYSTLLEVTDVEARAASDLAREAYAARFQWDSTEE